jgi:ubiquinone/menaquinone biosynthesis C-methylase UbiE
VSIDIQQPWRQSFLVAEACARLLLDHPLGRLLDAGGGEGMVTTYLMRSRKVDEAVVLDQNRGLLDQVPPPCHTKVGRIEDLGRSDGEFDTILLRQVLHYVASPEKALRTLRGRLRPGGAIYVGQMVAPNVNAATWLGTAANWVSAKRHRVWTVDQLLTRFASGGLSVEQASVVPHWQVLDDQAREHRESMPGAVKVALPVEDAPDGPYCRIFWLHALLRPTGS